MAEIKILAVADVHGDAADLRWILQNERGVNALFLLGDGLSDLDRAAAAAERNGHKPAYPLYRVRGNCDVGAPDPAEGLAPLGGVLFFYTHGHHYSVKSGYDALTETAQARGADVALFGHTHRRALVNDGLSRLPTLFNPGSLRDSGSYGVITVESGLCHFYWKLVPQ